MFFDFHFGEKKKIIPTFFSSPYVCLSPPSSFSLFILADRPSRRRRRRLTRPLFPPLPPPPLKKKKTQSVNLIAGPQALDEATRATGLASEFREGVLFTTYTSLSLKRPAGRRGIGGAARRSVSPTPLDDGTGGGGRRRRRAPKNQDDAALLSGTRLEQIIEWANGNEGRPFDGCLVFDEAHKAKNLHPDHELDADDEEGGGGGGEGGGGGGGDDDDEEIDSEDFGTGKPKKKKAKASKSSKVARVVNLIQAQLPEARVLYCSATGISETRNAGYLSR